MLNAVYTGLSGLKAYSEGLQTVSNNVANLNTAGFKSSDPRFSELFYLDRPPLGSAGGNSQSGNGVTYSHSRINFSQGDLRPSEDQLDLALNGRGFLILRHGNEQVYVRTGRFQPSASGAIVERESGYQLGLLKDGRVIGASIDGRTISKPQATTKISFADNLSSTGETHTISGIDTYDESGAKKTLDVAFTAKGADHQGKWNVVVKDAAGSTIKEFEISFIGSLIAPGSETIDVDIGSGAAAHTVTFDFGAITHLSTGTTSSMKVGSKDGYGTGEISFISVDESGELIINYSNAQKTSLGVVAVADFSDPSQLRLAGNSQFKAPDEAQYRLLQSGQDGVGTVTGKSQEASNVDLSGEFGELILVQRGFQASSQVLNMANEMIQQLFDLQGRR